LPLSPGGEDNRLELQAEVEKLYHSIDSKNTRQRMLGEKRCHLESIPLTGSLGSSLRKPCTEPELYWLGQAGFLFRSAGLTFAIDPYLSDRLAEKYRNHRFSHQRMMPAPLSYQELPELDFVFCTHQHGDHLDAPTLEWIAANRPFTRFVVPAGIEEEVSRLAIPMERVLWAEADRPVRLNSDFEVFPIPAAHEEFAFDTAGHHRFLGYVFRWGSLSVYHSGDTIPYHGLTERIAAFGLDLALLPVNGRRRELSEQKIAGNFTLAEAIDLSHSANIPILMAHHYGMFAFNTIDPALVDVAARGAPLSVRVFRAETGCRYLLRDSA
jgi:L-ascorbate metabolism protein UlaG (beta-lactamase superfamily)